MNIPYSTYKYDYENNKSNSLDVVLHGDLLELLQSALLAARVHNPLEEDRLQEPVLEVARGALLEELRAGDCHTPGGEGAPQERAREMRVGEREALGACSGRRASECAPRAEHAPLETQFALRDGRQEHLPPQLHETQPRHEATPLELCHEVMRVRALSQLAATLGALLLLEFRLRDSNIATGIGTDKSSEQIYMYGLRSM